MVSIEIFVDDNLVFQRSLLDPAKVEAKVTRQLKTETGVFDFEVWVEKHALTGEITDVYGYVYQDGAEVQLDDTVSFVLSRLKTYGWWIFKWQQVEYYDIDRQAWLSYSDMFVDMDED